MDYGAMAGVADSAYKGLALGLSLADRAEERKRTTRRDAEESRLRQREEARKDAYLQMQQQQMERANVEYEAQAPIRQAAIAEATLSGNLLEEMNALNSQIKEAQTKWGPSLNHSEKMGQLAQLAQSRDPQFLDVLKGSGMAQDAQYTEDGNIVIKNRLGQDLIFNDNDIKTLYESSQAAADVIYNNAVKGLIDRKNKLMSQYQQLKGREQSDEYFAQRRAIEGARQQSAEDIQAMKSEMAGEKARTAASTAAERALAKTESDKQKAQAARVKSVEAQAFKLLTPHKGQKVTPENRAMAASMLYEAGSSQAPPVFESFLKSYSESWSSRGGKWSDLKSVIGAITGASPTDDQVQSIYDTYKAGKSTWSKEELMGVVGGRAQPVGVDAPSGPAPSVAPQTSHVINIIGSDGKTRAINTAKFTMADILAADPGAKLEDGTPVADVIAAQQAPRGL